MEVEVYFIVDSLPLEICKFARHHRIKICKKSFKQLLQKDSVLHKTLGFMDINFTEFVLYQMFFHSLDSTKGEVHDVYFLRNIKQQVSDCLLLGDRGYL